MACAASCGDEPPGVHRQQMQLVAEWFGLWIDDDVNVARAQAAATTKEAERKARRKLEARNQLVAAPLENLFDALLCRRAMRHIHEIGERAFAVAHALAAAALLFHLFSVARPTRFDHHGE